MLDKDKYRFISLKIPNKKSQKKTWNWQKNHYTDVVDEYLLTS